MKIRTFKILDVETVRPDTYRVVVGTNHGEIRIFCYPTGPLSIRGDSADRFLDCDLSDTQRNKVKKAIKKHIAGGA